MFLTTNLDTHDIISTFKFDYQQLKKKKLSHKNQEMISISTKCLLSDPDNFVCICYIPVLFEFNKILFTPRIFEGTLCNLKKKEKKWWEPQYLANPPNLTLSGVTHSLKTLLIFLILFPKFSEWHHIYTLIGKALQHKKSPVFGLCDNFLLLKTY